MQRPLHGGCGVSLHAEVNSAGNGIASRIARRKTRLSSVSVTFIGSSQTPAIAPNRFSSRAGAVKRVTHGLYARRCPTRDMTALVYTDGVRNLLGPVAPMCAI